MEDLAHRPPPHDDPYPEDEHTISLDGPRQLDPLDDTPEPEHPESLWARRPTKNPVLVVWCCRARTSADS